MNKIVKNSALIKNALIIAFGGLLTLINVIYLCQTFYFKNDGWGSSIEFNENYIFALICSVIILIYGIINLINFKKNKDNGNLVYYTFGTISFMLAFYPLGKFFKGLAKQKEFVSIQDYLYLSLLGFVLLAYFIFHYLAKNKNNK